MHKVAEFVMCARNDIAHESLLNAVNVMLNCKREIYSIEISVNADREVVVDIEVNCDEDVLSAGVMFGKCLIKTDGLFERAGYALVWAGDM